MAADQAILAGALTAAMRVCSTWLVSAAQTYRGRLRGRDRAIAGWFDTLELTAAPDSQLFFPKDVDLDAVHTWLFGHEAQAVLHELIAIRLTDAPESAVDCAKKNLLYSCIAAFPDLSEELQEIISERVFREADHQLKELLSRLEKLNPRFQSQVREEAFAGRHAALLESIARHTEILAGTSPVNARKEIDFLSRYRKIIVREHGSLEPPDFEQRRRIPIGDIYVTPRIAMPFHDDVGPTEEIDVWELGKRLDRSVLLGDPGGGKSTASHALIHHFASDEKSRVPLLVILREYAREDPPDLSILGYLEHRLETHYQCKPPSGLVERMLATGRAAVFFDGLDELVDTRRRREVTRRVENFCDQYPHTPVLVTSRRVGYIQAKLDDQQFVTYQLAGFTTAQAKEYALKWFKQERRLSDKEPTAWANSFIQESSGILDLRSNPLTLALLCLLYRGEDSLPRNRPAVYERCATLLFEKWDSSRGIHSNLKARDLIEPVLRHLAHWLLTRGSAEPAVTEEQLVAETTDYLQDRRFEDIDEAVVAAREFVSFCRGRAWVFNEVGSTADGEALFTFTHRTFLEYFAARYIASVNDTPEQLARALAPRIVREEWDVVAQLAVQSKDRNTQDGAARFYDTLLNTRRYSAIESVSNLLGFLCRSLSFLDLPPRIIRELARRSFEELLIDPLEPRRLAPLSYLMSQCGRNIGLVTEMYCNLVRQAAVSSDDARQTVALKLLCSELYPLHTINRIGEVAHSQGAANKSTEEHWREAFTSLLNELKQVIIDASRTDKTLSNWSFVRGWIPLTDAITSAGGLWKLLFGDFPVGVGQARYVDTARLIIGNCFGVYGGEKTVPVDQLAQVSHYARENLDSPPWRCDNTENIGWWFDPVQQSKAMIGELDMASRTGLYLVMATILEMHESSPHREIPKNLGQVGPFAAYWKRRQLAVQGGDSVPEDSRDLPMLAVEDWLQTILLDWAEMRLNLWQGTSARFSGK